MSNNGLRVRPAQERDRRTLTDLIYLEDCVHRHLDWHPPLTWLGRQPCLVAESKRKLLATLICPPDPPEITWIRLFAVSSLLSVQMAWQALWPPAKGQLCGQVAAITSQPWFRDLLEQEHFIHTHDVVSLLWVCECNPPQPRNQSVFIRAMEREDLPTIVELDAAAFGPMWRNSPDALEIAWQQAVIATLAEVSGKIAGYQISTPHPIGGHLARLAVHPVAQRNGIGYALLWDLLDTFRQRGAQRVTVNTQKDNLASLRLYAKAGFRRTGEDYPVYQLLV
jgi:ribosomal protein S18 acetylase RimI-like enzyme